MGNATPAAAAAVVVHFPSMRKSDCLQQSYSLLLQASRWHCTIFHQLEQGSAEPINS